MGLRVERQGPWRAAAGLLPHPGILQPARIVGQFPGLNDLDLGFFQRRTNQLTVTAGDFGVALGERAWKQTVVDVEFGEVNRDPALGQFAEIGAKVAGIEAKLGEPMALQSDGVEPDACLLRLIDERQKAVPVRFWRAPWVFPFGAGFIDGDSAAWIGGAGALQGGEDVSMPIAANQGPFRKPPG